MAASLLERVPVDGITAQARQVRFWRTFLTVVAALLFGAGWAAAKTAKLVLRLAAGAWLGLSWSAVAVREGWRQGWQEDRRVNRGAA